MRHFVLSFALLATACGGVVQGDPDGGFPCPVTQPNTMSCASEGAQCAFATTVCGQTSDVTCTCVNGAWSCPSYNGGECPAQGVCPSNVEPGTACSAKGTICVMAYDGCPEDQDMPCTCDGQEFQCLSKSPSCSQCPPPSEVVPGAACGASGACPSFAPGCDGGAFDNCQCIGGAWQCEGPVCVGAIDAGAAD